MWKAVVAVATIAVGGGVGVAAGQLDQRPFNASLDHPAIQYASGPIRDAVTRLNGALNEGNVQLPADTGRVLLRAVLHALNVPIESQIVAFSKTSVQSPRITPQNPRTLFFNDSVTVGWVAGGFIEVAAVDPRQGVIFYTMQSDAATKPQFVRRTSCLSCHESYSSLDVPGMLAKSVFPAADGTAMYQFGSYLPDHRTPFAERWGGWYVTGKTGRLPHMGSAILADPTARPSDVDRPEMHAASIQLDPAAYLSPYSDVAALMVFTHQTRMTNLLIRVGWEFRVALYEQAGPFAATASLRDMVNELVDYLLFVDEAQLPAPIRGTSGFAETFSASGRHDRQGRSLRHLDLRTRLLQYPCSYMIYTDLFDALPAAAKEEIYARMWRLLSGEDRSQRYARLSLADRRAIVEILRDTKSGLPSYFERQVH